MSLSLQRLMPADTTYTAPEAGFNALRPEPQYHQITRHYKERNCELLLTVSLIKAPTQREAEKMVQKLDRIHDFYCGQAVGFVSIVKKIMTTDLDTFNPGRAVQKINDHLQIMEADLARYVKVVQSIDPEQIKLELK